MREVAHDRCVQHHDESVQCIVVQQVEHANQTRQRGQAFGRFKDRDGVEGAALVGVLCHGEKFRELFQKVENLLCIVKSENKLIIQRCPCFNLDPTVNAVIVICHLAAPRLEFARLNVRFALIAQSTNLMASAQIAEESWWLGRAGRKRS